MKFAQTLKDHYARYTFALPYVAKRDTHDVGAKDGFGSLIFSFVAKSLTLSDISVPWLNRAEKRGGFACPTNFVICDYDKDFPEGSWDTITAFEVIEHVENPEFLIKNIASHLRPNGFFVYSVPHMVANHEHKTLFDAEKIHNLVGKYLTVEEKYTQDKTPISDKKLYRGLVCHVGVARKS